MPRRNFDLPPQMIIIRSFDVNLPGTEEDKVIGGIVGGSIIQGVLKVNQDIEIRPGIVRTNASGEFTCTPILSKVISLKAEKNQLSFAVPGGLIGVGMQVDPTLTRADRLVGQVLGQVGNLPDIFFELDINFFLLRRLLGVKTLDGKKQTKIAKLTINEVLMLNIGSMCAGAWVKAVEDEQAKLKLKSPVCTKNGEKVALSRRIDKHWRLIGWGSITSGVTK